MTDAPPVIRLLVCGGRDFADYALMQTYLDSFVAGMRESHAGARIVLINGGATGADALAVKWASTCPYIDTVETYLAQWHLYGRMAGPIRNQQMLSHGRPDTVIAFPGGRGTADMVWRANAAHIPVVRVPVAG